MFHLPSVVIAISIIVVCAMGQPAAKRLLTAERETVTPVNSFRAFGQANSELIRLRDIARPQSPRQRTGVR